MIASVDNYVQLLQELSVPAKESFRIQRGAGSVFVSAPHSFAHLRDGVQKSAEPGSAALALLLAQNLGCSVAYRTSLAGGDPNWDESSDYRSKVHEAVCDWGCKLLLDLHQLSPARDVDVDLGTASGNNLLGQVWIAKYMVEAFKAAGFRNVLVDKPFAARKPQTVAASTVLLCKIPAVQVEMNSRYLLPDFPEFDPLRVYEALSNVVLHMEKVMQV